MAGTSGHVAPTEATSAPVEALRRRRAHLVAEIQRKGSQPALVTALAAIAAEICRRSGASTQPRWADLIGYTEGPVERCGRPSLHSNITPREKGAHRELTRSANP